MGQCVQEAFIISISGVKQESRIIFRIFLHQVKNQESYSWEFISIKNRDCFFNLNSSKQESKSINQEFKKWEIKNQELIMNIQSEKKTTFLEDPIKNGSE